MNDCNVAPQTEPFFHSLKHDDVYDVIIIGGGPAGLSAALILGRCRRKVLIIDAGEPRNRWSHSMHGYLSRDGVSPAEMAEASRRQVLEYPTVRLLSARAIDARRTEDERFVTTIAGGTEYLSRKLLLATGVVDDIPKIPGLMELYGTSVHHCPYCDGYEWSDRPIAVYGKDMCGFGLVQELTAWSRDLVLCTDGPSGLDTPMREYLDCLRIIVREEPVDRLESVEGKLTRVHFLDGTSIERDALFFCAGQCQASGIAMKLGCRLTDQGCIWTGDSETTDIPGLYCAGDASRNAQMVIVAAAEGAQAAVSINKALTGEYKDAKQEQVGVKL